MKRIFETALFAPAVLLAAGVMLAGCSELQHRDVASGPATGQVASTAIPSLAGTRWQVTQVADKPVPAAISPTVQFDDKGHVFGSTGCNQFSGAYWLENGGLRVERLATTRKLCFPAIMYQEEALLRVLRGAERVYLLEEDLILESARERGLSRMIPLS